MFKIIYCDNTYLGPADINGQLSSVQKSVIVPYSMLIWLKKSTAMGSKHKQYYSMNIPDQLCLCIICKCIYTHRAKSHNTLNYTFD